MNEAASHLVIIGGGQAARWLLFAIAEHFSRERERGAALRITVIERRAEFGTGLAWSRDNVLPEHLASRAASIPRLHYGEQQMMQFHKTVSFLEELGVTVTQLANEEVICIDEDSARYYLSTNSGRRIDANYVVLATGYGSGPFRGQVSQFQTPMSTTDSVYHSPWPAKDLQTKVFHSSSGCRKILLLGSYLTAVDTAITLALAAGEFVPNEGRLLYKPARDFQIVMASRNGVLPTIWHRKDGMRWELRRFTDSSMTDSLEKTSNGVFLSLNRALDLLGQELLDAASLRGCIPPPLRKSVSAVRRLRALQSVLSRNGGEHVLHEAVAQIHAGCEGRAGQENSFDWQAPIDQAIIVWNEYSPWFSAEDTLLFDRQIRSIFFNFMLPMNISSALQLQALISAGCLRIEAIGEHYDLKIENNALTRFHLTYRTARGKYASEYFTDVVDATGGARALSVPRDRLSTSLLSKGFAQQSLRPFRDSLNARNVASSVSDRIFCHGATAFLRFSGYFVNPKTCELIPSGVVGIDYTRPCRKGLYAMGPNLSGQFADAQSIGHIQRDARRIVADLRRKKNELHNEV